MVWSSTTCSPGVFFFNQSISVRSVQKLKYSWYHDFTAFLLSSFTIFFVLIWPLCSSHLLGFFPLNSIITVINQSLNSIDGCKFWRLCWHPIWQLGHIWELLGWSTRTFLPLNVVYSLVVSTVFYWSAFLCVLFICFSDTPDLRTGRDAETGNKGAP